tara:strand:+ start:365 stop:853 length:489 start_codon:yes stop_codon:yes gene_type:complete
LQGFFRVGPDLRIQVIEADGAIDELEIEINLEAIRYITLRAPLASDLRLFMIGRKESHDLERVGDEASGIAKRVIRISRVEPLQIEMEVPQMLELALKMFGDAINVFLEGDIKIAGQIVKRDRILDEFHNSAFEAHTNHIMAHSSDAVACLECLFSSNHLKG